MADEPIENNGDGGAEGDDRYADYIAQIKALKASTVSRSEYDAIQKANKELLASIVDGTNAPAPRATEQQDPPEVYETTKKRVDRIKVLRNELYGKNPVDVSDRVYCEKTLELRRLVMENGEPDPMVPRGNKYTPTKDDEAAAARVAEMLQACVDQAQGDDSAFKVAFVRSIKDVRLGR